MSGSALRHTQPPTHGVLEVVFLRDKAAKTWSWLLISIQPHVFMGWCLSTEATLPLLTSNSLKLLNILTLKFKINRI
jgi:hypothetical protein